MFERFLNNQAFWERAYIDPWTIPHTLFGVVASFLTVFTGIGLWVGFGFTTVIAIGWEIFEHLTKFGNEEAITNSITDIIVAQVGFIVGIYILSKVSGSTDRWVLFSIVTIIWIAFELLGWLAYSHYTGGHA